MSRAFTTGDVARRYGIPLWNVIRLYQRGLLPPADRIGSYRVVKEEDLPAVEAALRKAKYLPQEREAAPC